MKNKEKTKHRQDEMMKIKKNTQKSKEKQTKWTRNERTRNKQE